jgi:hypothetical protein
MTRVVTGLLRLLAAESWLNREHRLPLQGPNHREVLEVDNLVLASAVLK